LTNGHTHSHVEHTHHDHHDHGKMSDDEHARAHAATLPAYVATGERPTALQVMTFGAAGGLIPCPAAVTVMLLSLAAAKSGKGVFLVLGFSTGLAVTLGPGGGDGPEQAGRDRSVVLVVAARSVHFGGAGNSFGHGRSDARSCGQTLSTKV
jgi:hypothetical protein